MVRRWLRWAHLWTGLALSVLLFVFALTGAALVYKEAYWRVVYPELRAQLPELDAQDHAAAVAAARLEFGNALVSVKLPEPGVNAYHLYLDGGEAFLSAHDHRVIDRWSPAQRPMALLFDLHAHLMAGETGERVGGVIALLGTLLALTGLILWWPTRRRFSIRGSMLPRSTARHHLIAWHRDLGVLWSIPLLVLLLSAAGLVFYETAGRLLAGVLGGDPAAVAEAAAEAAPGPESATRLTPVAFAAAARVFPDARIVFYYPPAEGEPVHRFRMRRDCELHSNGRTYVTVDGSGAVLQATDACTLGAATRTQHAFYPLHSGKAMGVAYKLVIFVASLALAALALGGVLAYARKLLRGQPRELAGPAA